MKVQKLQRIALECGASHINIDEIGNVKILPS